MTFIYFVNWQSGQQTKNVEVDQTLLNCSTGAQMSIGDYLELKVERVKMIQSLGF